MSQVEGVAVPPCGWRAQAHIAHFATPARFYGFLVHSRAPYTGDDTRVGGVLAAGGVSNTPHLFQRVGCAVVHCPTCTANFLPRFML